jgi:uncharacterized membrane protein
MEAALFTEKQYFRQPWLWLLLGSINVVLFYGVIQQVVFHHPFGNKPSSDDGLIIAAGVFLLVSILLAFVHLDTAIAVDGIYYRFWPFQFNAKKIPWEEVERAYVRQYNPLLEYGGWGLRLGIFGKGPAFNISGNMGLQIHYTNGKKFLLGTQKPEELEAILRQLGRG